MSSALRVLHLIDSLELGGAERMAVNLVNALHRRGVEAHLVVSRKEGPLRSALSNGGRYFFLGKRRALDVRTWLRLLRYVRRHRIQLIHAHSTSLGWAAVISFFAPVAVVWHNHYGHSEFLDQRSARILRWLAKRTRHIIAVNQKLAAWAVRQLHYPKERVSYLPNFPDLALPAQTRDRPSRSIPVIVCTANLREPKDHDVLAQALYRIKQQGIPFQAWLIGKDYSDAYSQRLKALIQTLGMEKDILIWGSQNDIGAWLIQADIGVLASSSEGLPVALLEYGLAGLAVVCTSVGECPSVLGEGKYGILVPPKSPEKLSEALSELLQCAQKRRELSAAFQKQIQETYSKDAVVNQLQGIYYSVISPNNSAA